MSEKINFLTIVKNNLEEPEICNKYNLVISFLRDKSCEYVSFLFSCEQDIILFYNSLLDIKETTVNDDFISQIKNIPITNIEDKDTLLKTISEYQFYNIEKYFIDGYFNNYGIKEKIIINSKISFSFDYDLILNAYDEIFYIEGEIYKSIMFNDFELVDTDDENYIINVDSDFFARYLDPSLGIIFKEEFTTLCINKDTLQVYSSSIKFNNLKCFLKIKARN